MKFKKILRRLLRVFLVVLLVTCLILAYIINFVLTPEKITPEIVKLLNNELNATVNCESAEITFFSTFPKVSVLLKNTSIITLSTGTAKDTLASFKEAAVSLDLYQYLAHDKIEVQKIAIDRPKLHAFISKEGTTNWDILKESTEDGNESSTIKGIAVENFQITDATLVYEDGKTNLSYFSNAFSLKLNAKKNDSGIQFATSIESSDISVFMKDTFVYKLDKISADAAIEYSKATKTVTLKANDITVNDIHFQTSGTAVVKDKNVYDLHLKARLATNSLNNIVSFIPTQFALRKDIKAEGRIYIDLETNGLYGKGALPELGWRVKVEDARLAYAKFPAALDLFTADIEGMLDFSKHKKSYAIINGLTVEGTDTRVTATGKVDNILQQPFIAAHLKGDIASLATLVAFVPEQYLPKNDLKAKGRASFDAAVEGLYGKGIYPAIKYQLNVNDISFAYKNFPVTVSELQAAVSGTLYPDNSRPSDAALSNLRIKGTGINLEGKGKVSNLLGNAALQGQIRGTLDLTQLYSKFPIANTALKGMATIDLQTIVTLDQIKTKQYDKINAAGTIELSHIAYATVTDSIHFSAEKLNVNFYRELQLYNQTFAEIKSSETKFSYKDNSSLNAKTLSLDATIGTTKEKKITVTVAALLEDVAGGVKKDSIELLMKRTRLTGSFNPGEKGGKAYVISNLVIDSLGVAQKGNIVAIQQGTYDIRVDQETTEKWIPKGNFRFQSLIAVLPKLENIITMPATAISFNNDDFSLDQARFSYGASDVTLTGNVKSALGFYNGNAVTANLDLKSGYIDANQLMTAFAGISVLAASEDTTEKSQSVVLSDTVANTKHAFRIPQNLRFDFTTSVDKVKFGYSDFNEITGILQLRDGNMYLNDFKLQTLAANLTADVVYTAQNNKEAAVDFKFYLTQIELSKLNEFLPFLDQLFPITKSFQGKADFRIKGSAGLTENLDFNIETLKGVAALQAHDIMVLDSPSFKELAKTFFFKSKKLNPIEELKVEMEFADSKLSVLPALLEIDRYKLAIGGEQRMDMSYSYHVSVLDSPIPFKLGVNITGTGADFDYRLTKAKYKYYFTDTERLLEKADTTVIDKKAFILKQLEF